MLLSQFKHVFFNTRVIVVTAHEEYGAQALPADAVYCLLKPISADYLAEALTHLKHLD